MKKLFQSRSELYELINTANFDYFSTFALPDYPQRGKEYYYIRIPNIEAKMPQVETGLVRLIAYDETYETIEVLPCSINLMYIHVIDIFINDYDKFKYERCRQIFDFHVRVYNKDYMTNKVFHINCTVQEFAGYCCVLNYYVDNNYKIEDINLEKLFTKRTEEKEFRHPYSLLGINENNKYSDFLQMLYSSDYTYVSELSNSYRYHCDFEKKYEILSFFTTNIVFAEILENILKVKKIYDDGKYIVEIRTRSIITEKSWDTPFYEKQRPCTKIGKSNGLFKKETIDKIIYESHRNFPSELEIICKKIRDYDTNDSL